MSYTGTISKTAAVLLLSAGLFAQQSSAPPAAGSTPPRTSTIRGCLRGERNNYILMENRTNTAYVLKGVGNKLDNFRRKEVEVTGQILSGTVKTGVTPEKAGSNPADTVHGVDGVPFQVNNIDTDIKIISNKCKATSEQN
ncbi:MAG TPA: hypothetical protein VF753_10195 [Terriglobales bacterium]